MSSILTELGVLSPERVSRGALTVEQQEVIVAFRTGQMTEKELWKHLSQDSALSDHLSDETPTG